MKCISIPIRIWCLGSDASCIACCVRANEIVGVDCVHVCLPDTGHTSLHCVPTTSLAYVFLCDIVFVIWSFRSCSKFYGFFTAPNCSDNQFSMGRHSSLTIYIQLNTSIDVRMIVDRFIVRRSIQCIVAGAFFVSQFSSCNWFAFAVLSETARQKKRIDFAAPVQVQSNPITIGVEQFSLITYSLPHMRFYATRLWPDDCKSQFAMRFIFIVALADHIDWV